MPVAVVTEQLERMRRQQAAILDLARRQRQHMTDADADAALHEIAAVAARTLGVARAGVWMLTTDRQELRCLVLHQEPAGRGHEQPAGRVREPEPLRARDYPRYFAALESGRAIDAGVAREDPRTSEFRAGYLEPLGITSMLDAAVREGGQVAGVVCHEHVGAPRAWTTDELAFAGAIADQVALVVAARERRRLEEERERMREQLVHTQRLESLGALAAGVAHEINNPLAYLSSNVDLVAEALARPSRFTHEELVAAVRDAQEAIERVRLLVRDLRTFARSGGRERKSFDVHRAIDDAIKVAWNEIRHRARLVKDYGDLPPVVADEAGLGQVFLNLLVNAAQAIEEGHADRNEIRVTTRVEGPWIEVQVRDSGRGIPADIQQRIFDPFFTTKALGQGTGLGLSICLSLVQADGGTLGVDSAPGRGACFTVRLPVVGGAPAVASPAPPPAPRAGPGRRARVLVVDDEEGLVTAVCRYFGHDHDMVGATSAAAALERVHAGERFDVILCDLIMPEMTGMELWQELQRVAPDQAERMVFLTGGAFTPRAREFMETTAQPRVEKPFRMADLRALIEARLA
jgi:signal transduction histidine kinase/CheY-like chemotaxis protein